MEWEQPYSPRSPTGTQGYYTPTNDAKGGGLRRRTGNTYMTPEAYSNTSTNGSGKSKSYEKTMKKRLQKLDMFPKVEQDLQMSAEPNSALNILATVLVVIIVFAEIYNHYSINNTMIQHVTVDKSLGTKMRVDLDITFPALHCNDVHIDIMDVAGDAHNDVHDTMEKTRLHLDGSRLSEDEISVSVNRAHQKEKAALEALDKSLAKDYCGPCYGAQMEEGQCCNHCDDVLKAYNDKHWDANAVKMLAEQCIREGKTKPKKLEEAGEGCRIAGFMEFGRVNGNFHIAMGEGVERNGQHIHTFLPEDTSRYNCSHIINKLQFGPVFDNDVGDLESSLGLMEKTSLNGVTKIITEENGVSGMFQYFIKIVPTSFKGKKVVKEIQRDFDMSKEPLLETNRYFVTERFTPLVEVDEEDWEMGMLVDQDDDEQDIAGTKVGGKTGLGHDNEHLKQKAILPGLFFIYQVYPFAVEISKNEVPFMHLLIRIIATIGGLYTIAGWLDSALCSKKNKKPTVF